MGTDVKSVAATIVFVDFCDLLDEIKTSPKQEHKQAKLANFIKEFRAKGQDLSQINPNIETTFYPVMRLLLPQCERERSAYGLKELALAKSIARILGLNSKGEDARGLMKAASSGTDFGEAAYIILRKHFSGTKRLSISDINEKLDAVSKKNSENDIRGQEDEIFKLFKSTSPNEQRWLVRIILKKLSLGLGQNKILHLYHPDAVDLFDSNNSLSKTCETLHDPSVRINEIEISLFTPFRPMLSQRCDAKEFLKTVTASAKFLVETKFDGERFQLHMSDGNFKYFSRNGFNYTKNYGADFNNGVYTPYLKQVFKPDVQSVILDGEMMGWDTVTKKFGSKGMIFDVKKLLDTSRYQPCFCVFDLILLNKSVLTNKPFVHRMEVLKSILKPIEGVIMISTKSEAKGKQEILDALNSSMDRDEEGIVFKNPESTYAPNDRKGGWWKMKLEYFANVMSDLDVIVMGAYRKGRKLAGFSVGVAEPSKSGTPTKFLSLARIASGLTIEEMESIDTKLGPHWKEMSDGGYEKRGLYFGKDKPDIWVEPKHSCVLLVRGAELIKSYGNNPDFKTRYTLRFPRILSIRFDKPYYNCLSTIELDELTTGRTPVQKLYKRHLDLTDVEFEGKTVKKRKARFQIEGDEDEIQASSTLLKGYEFCVLSGTKEWTKTDVEKEIKQSGGTIVKMEGQNTFCILVGDNHSRVQYYKGVVDMVRLPWLKSVLEKHRFVLYKPEHMIYTGPSTKDRFLFEYDKYGDSYTEKATRVSLETVFKNILARKDYINPASVEINAFHEDIDFPYQFGLFRDCHAYFDKYKVINEPDSERILSCPLEEAEFQFWGGTVRPYLTKEVDLVVMKFDSELRREVITSYLGEIHNKNAKIVTKDYISERVSEYKSF